jgi:hypothetical protein
VAGSSRWQTPPGGKTIRGRPLPHRLIWKTNGKERFVTFSLGNVAEYFCDIPELNAWMASTKMLKDLTCNVS